MLIWFPSNCAIISTYISNDSYFVYKLLMFYEYLGECFVQKSHYIFFKTSMNT